MPSSKNYVRNYSEEYKTAKARGEVDGGHDGENAKRKRARRAALKKGLVKKGQDWDHKQPLSKGGANDLANGRARSVHDNRSFPRNAKGGMVKNVPKT
jgi:hypothetical protein